MKTAAKIIFLVNDDVGAAIARSLRPPPNSSLQRTEETFNLPLDKYDIKGGNSSGELVNFVDHLGCPQLSIVLLQGYEPPIVVCAVNEVLASIMAQGFSNTLTFIVPIVITEQGHHGVMRKFTFVDNSSSIYGAHLGPATDTTEHMISRVQKLPLSFRISSEPLACLLELVRILNLPIVFLVGSGGQHKPESDVHEELQALANVGEFLATCFGLFFSKDLMHLIPISKSKTTQQPWQALYG